MGSVSEETYYEFRKVTLVPKAAPVQARKVTPPRQSRKVTPPRQCRSEPAICAWCKQQVTDPAPQQRFCDDACRAQYRTCQKKITFYTKQAAQFAAAQLVAELGVYLCPGGDGDHWHLFSIEKRRAKRNSTRGERRKVSRHPNVRRQLAA